MEDSFKRYEVDQNKFTESGRNTIDLGASFYESAHSIAIENETNEKYIKIEISKLNSYQFDLRYRSFISIMGNIPPFSKFRGYNEDIEKTCFYIQYDPDNTLQKKLQNNDNLNDTVKSQTVLAAAAALAYGHFMDVSCRFMHPESIVYDQNDEPYIVNLGYSGSMYNNDNSSFNLRMVNLDKPLFSNLGSYIAPEMLENPHSSPFPSDVYAFGTLLYSLITEKEMFDSNLKKEEILSLINENKFPEIEEDLCDPFLIELVEHCHKIKPEDRYSSSQILEYLLKFDKPLFPNCTMRQYNEYRKKIMEYIGFYKKVDIRTEEDPRKLFIYGNHLLNTLNDDVDLEKDIQVSKKDIGLYLKTAASRYDPAIYKYALFLDSNIDSKDDPLLLMEKAANNQVFDAYYKLGLMYDRRGFHRKANDIYNKYQNYNIKCKINYALSSNQPMNEIFKNIDISSRNIAQYENDKMPSHRISEFLMYYYKVQVENVTVNSVDSFIKKMTILAKKIDSGKPYYLIAALLRDKSISDKVFKEIDGYLTFEDDINQRSSSSSIEKDEEDLAKLDELFSNEDEYLKYLRSAAKRFYEPAVADLTIYYLEKNQIGKAKDILSRFFSKMKCKHDNSRARIQHAYAMYCEKTGQLEPNPKKRTEMLNKALRIYKESADEGYIKSNFDYVRLYKENKNANPLLVKYYTKRASLIENEKL